MLKNRSKKIVVLKNVEEQQSNRQSNELATETISHHIIYIPSVLVKIK